jgi:hypothetical protein
MEPREYFIILTGDGFPIIVEITPAIKQVIAEQFENDYEVYLAEVICEKFDIEFNNCQWSLCTGVEFHGEYLEVSDYPKLMPYE